MATRITYEVVNDIGEHILNFETRKEAENWIEEASKKGFIKDVSKIKIVSKQSKPYKLGEKWRPDFDYLGMLATGTKADVNWGIEKLEKLFDSFEDVNYHKESHPLHEAIYYLKLGAYKDAEKELSNFRNLCKKYFKKIS